MYLVHTQAGGVAKVVERLVEDLSPTPQYFQ
jgi:hypothetical protein